MARDGGFLIAIEGPDAAGKRTQSSKLVSWFSEKGVRAFTMSFPDYGTPIGKEILTFLESKRDYPAQVRHMLFAANRWEKRDKILHLLEQNTFLVVNRYTESNIVYGTANGLDEKWLWNLEHGMPKTDLVVVLDIGLEEIKFRRKRFDMYEGDLSLQEKVRSIYQCLAEKHDWQVVDGRGTIDKVHNSIKEIITRKFSKLVPELQEGEG
jgi:dTMP kinase